MIDTKTLKMHSYASVPETCPDIDAALRDGVDLIEKVVKDKTEDLRYNLELWIERALDAEDSLYDAQNEIERLKEEISFLQK